MNETKVILLCGSRIAIPVIRDLFFHKQLAAIVIPEHCTDFIQQVQLLLKDSGMPVIIVGKNDFTDKLQTAIKAYAPTMGLLFTFSYKLPAAIYKMPVKGFYNIHPGPLPAYRGPDPIFQQIKNKETYAAITIHKVDDGLDTGQIVLSDKIHLNVTDTYGILTTKLSELAAGLVGTLVKMAGFDMELPSRPQDNSLAKYYQRQSATDITINWQTMNAATVVALINACNPWNKGAVTKLNNNIIRLLDAYRVTSNAISGNEPGTILSIDENGVTIALAGHEAICVRMVYHEEGFLMANRLKEFAIIPGNRFELISTE
jgi:methionyl-tRNA formyltransferase